MIRKYYIIFMFLFFSFSSYANEVTNFSSQPVFIDRDLKESQIPARDTADSISINKKKILGEESAALNENKYANSLSEDKVKKKYNKRESRTIRKNQKKSSPKAGDVIKEKGINPEKYNRPQANLKWPPPDGSWLLDDNSWSSEKGSHKEK